MLPAGYMRKRVASNSEWLQTEGVTDVYSVSNCLSNDFADYINFWRHNGYWLFNSPAIIEEISRVENIDLTNTKLFYYEVFEFEYDEDQMQWVTFDPEPSFTTEVKAPTNMQLEGFDVVTFSVHTSPECSPLSCCALAKDLTVNQHCLFRTFAEAKEAIDRGLFNNSEPGPYRIFSVYATAAEPSLRGDGREAAFLGSPSPAAPGRSSSLTLNVIKTKMADRNKIFYRINASLCAIPIISALLLYLEFGVSANTKLKQYIKNKNHKKLLT